MVMETTTQLCMGCMTGKGAEAFCLQCGWQEGALPESPFCLPPKTLLNGQYLLGKVVGIGGFGITYLAWDANLKLKLAVKEYLPTELATRTPGSSQVMPFTGDAREFYEYGLSKFIEEARSLAQFQEHPNIVSVHNFFYANNTGYLVMNYVDGITFKKYLEKEGGRIAFDAAVKIMIPVMDALREVHRAGMLHRDISPDNIYLTYTNQVKLLDFGAARYAIGEQSKSLSVILKQGYAPVEQYISNGNQGAWTDVYALAATIYRAITGQVPQESIARLQRDDLAPPSQLGIIIPAPAEAALMKALALKPADRFQSISEFQAAIAPPANQQNLIVAAPPKSPALWKVIALLVAIVMGLIILILAANLTSAASRYDREQKTLKERVERVESEKKKTENQLTAELEAKKALTAKYADRQLSISGIRLRNKDQDGHRLSADYEEESRRFRQADMRYLAIEIETRNNWVGLADLKGKLKVRIYKPLATVCEKPEGSRDDFTLAMDMDSKDTKTLQTMWGTETGNYYLVGNYRVEFWWAGEKIATERFEIFTY